jgi:biotin transporter BioY
MFQLAYIIAAFLAGIVSITIEKKQRRAELAVYCSNHAAEAIFNMLVARG